MELESLKPRNSRRSSLMRSLSRAASKGAPSITPDSLLSTICAGNIHCDTCINHIENALGCVGPEIRDISVRLDSISVIHGPKVTTASLVQILLDEAFEVYSARTVNREGEVVYEKSFDPQADGWFDNEQERWVSGPGQRSSSNWCLQKTGLAPNDRETVNNKRKRHFSICSACSTDHDAGLSHNDHIPKKLKSLKKSASRKNDSLKQHLVKGTESLSTVNEESETHRSSDENQDANESSIQMWNLSLSIGGMTCSACSGAITEALEKLSSIKNVRIDLMSNSAEVLYGGVENDSDYIISEIEDLGYDASLVSRTRQSSPAPPNFTGQTPKTYRVRLCIEGMTCAACSTAISKGLKEFPFVKSANIVALTNSGEVFLEDRSNIDRILEKIDDLGYEAAVEDVSADLSLQDEVYSQKSKVRNVQIKVDGMFCGSCPPRVTEALHNRFGSRVKVEKAPTLKTPILTVVYEAEQPHLTIREIVATIEESHDDFGVTVYHPLTVEERSKQMQIHERNRILWRLMLSFLIVIPTFIIGIVFMELLPQSNPLHMFFMEEIWAGNVKRGEWAMFMLATPVYFFAADVFHLRAFKEIRALWRPGSRVPFLRRFYRFGSMNLLISAGTTVAFISSITLLGVTAASHGVSETNSSYFDSVVFLTFFILLGRLLEAVSKSKTSDAVSMLGELKPEKATLVIHTSDSASISSEYTQPTKSRIIPADLLEVGDTVIVAHGSSPPADGVIIKGDGIFDERSLTGESHPVSKTIGEKIFVGTINHGNPITMEVTDIGGSSMLDQIVTVVREGLSKRAPVERLAEILTGYFVPIITALAIITFIVWATLGYSGAITRVNIDGQTGGWAFYSLGFAISVFVAACPCGIGLAAPTALFVGIGLAAKHGILVRGGGEAFQEAPHVDIVVFDKTGTLTEGGDLKVSNYESLGNECEELTASLAARMEEQSSHPIARAIAAFLASKPQVNIEVCELSEEPGRGIRGTFAREGRMYEAVIGSPAYIKSLSSSLVEEHSFNGQTISNWQTQSQSIAVLALRQQDNPWQVASIFGTSDPIRPSAASTVSELRRQNIEVFMLSGDNLTTARAVGERVGIPAANIFAGVLPTQKADKIRQLQSSLSISSNRRRRFASPPSTVSVDANDPPAEKSTSTGNDQPRCRVAFVGDGINDAPALLAADVSISVSTGAPVALTASSFVLLTPSLLQIPLLLGLSRRVMRRVALNYGWALVYNIVLVPVAAGVLFCVKPEGWVLGPVWAALAMAGSSVSVVISSLLLRWEGFGQRYNKEEN